MHGQTQIIYHLCISATDVTNSNVPLHCMNVLGARGGKARLIFNLSIRRDHKLLSMHRMNELITLGGGVAWTSEPQ
jgi:hypothetical protein